MMGDREFVLVVNRPPTDDEMEQLADLAHDAGWTIDPSGHPYAEFTRCGSSLVGAVGSAISDLALIGLSATAVRPVDRLLDFEIADRVELSWPEINARVERSPVVHPKPMKDEKGYYCWHEVAAWLAAHGVPQDYDAQIDAINKALPRRLGNTDPDLLDRLVRVELRRANPWKMPEWMEPWRSYIGDHGGNTVEELVDSPHLEPHLMLTNHIRWGLALAVVGQVHLLMRLHRDGSLPLAPNHPGGWQ